MKKSPATNAAVGGMIAALYVILTYLTNMVGLASGAIQVRVSEALTILPCLTFSAIPGLTIGCILANWLTGCAFWDIIFGSLATLIGAVGTRLLKNKPLLAWIPPVVSNAVIVPIVLMKVYGVEDVTVFGQTFGGNSVWLMLVVTVGIGEIIACGIMGLLLWQSLRNIPQIKEMK